MYPAAYPNVLSVGATEWDDHKAFFSNYGATVDIAAPGVDILSTIPGAAYGSFWGTSMASPYVAGAAALVWGRWAALTRDGVRDLLLDTVDPVHPSSWGYAFPGHVGRLDVYDAFAARLGAPMPPSEGAVLGLVVDANTGLPLGGATVTARRGAVTRTATTRADGTFTVTNMPAGEHQLTAARSTYVTTTDETSWVAPPGEVTGLPFFALPRNTAADVYTAVLEWRGDCWCANYDMYLWLPGTLSPRNRYMVYYFDRENLNAHPFARLLRDEPLEMPPRAWGPLYAEAITFRTRHSGSYLLAIHDFGDCGQWACAGAVVRLYRGTTLVGTYSARDAAGAGRWWSVFRISGATVTPVQTLGDAFPGPYGN